MSSNTRTNAEHVRLTILDLVSGGSITVYELIEELGLSGDRMRLHLDVLMHEGCIARSDNKILSGNTHRWVYTFAPTGKPYDTKGKAHTPMTVEERRAYKKMLATRGKNKVLTIDIEEEEKPVTVQVNEYTTIYYNSRKKTQNNVRAKRKFYDVGIASTFSMI